MSKYPVDYDKLGSDLKPPFLRKVGLLSLVSLLLFPLVWLHGQFLSFIDSAKKDASYNFQTQHIERMLNDKFPNAGGLIYINHEYERFPREFIFYQSEGQPLEGYMYFESEGQPLEGYMHFDSEYDLEYDFLIMIPDTFAFTDEDWSYMKAYVNKNKLAGKRFNKQFYTP